MSRIRSYLGVALLQPTKRHLAVFGSEARMMDALRTATELAEYDRRVIAVRHVDRIIRFAAGGHLRFAHLGERERLMGIEVDFLDGDVEAPDWLLCRVRPE